MTSLTNPPMLHLPLVSASLLPMSCNRQDKFPYQVSILKSEQNPEFQHLNASTGCSSDAFHAGRRPNIIPTASDDPIARPIAGI